MVTSIREQIFEQSETPSAPVSSALIPNINNMLGVRLPPLRKLAKEIAKDDWRSYLNLPENQFFEEFMLQGMVIGYVNTDVEELLHYIAKFIPQIDNWSVCDSFYAGLKFTHTNLERVWDFLMPYFRTDKEYGSSLGYFNCFCKISRTHIGIFESK